MHTQLSTLGTPHATCRAHGGGTADSHKGEGHSVRKPDVQVQHGVLLLQRAQHDLCAGCSSRVCACVSRLVHAPAVWDGGPHDAARWVWVRQVAGKEGAGCCSHPSHVHHMPHLMTHKALLPHSTCPPPPSTSPQALSSQKLTTPAPPAGPACPHTRQAAGTGPAGAQRTSAQTPTQQARSAP